MRISTEKVLIESGGVLDGKLATAGWYPPQFTTGALPTASTHEGMLVYNTSTNKLNVSMGAGDWEAVTSST